MSPATIDIAGQRYGRLTVLVRVEPRTKNREAVWRCICDCEGMADVVSGSLRRGLTQSCGCLRWERTAAALTTHGHARKGAVHPLYGTWMRMRQRCRNRNHHAFAYYGGRGIAVAERWDSFANFLADMGEKPGPEYSIDRIDNDGNYEPGNCRWATAKEQRANRRDSSEVQSA